MAPARPKTPSFFIARQGNTSGLQAGAEGSTPEDWSNLASAVPEPAGVIAGIGLMSVILRRRA